MKDNKDARSEALLRILEHYQTKAAGLREELTHHLSKPDITDEEFKDFFDRNGDLIKELEAAVEVINRELDKLTGT
tara:strand:- start:168 stop:395 length:228 start_codon:yes stop_codon:yes gene_type:complete